MDPSTSDSLGFRMIDRRGKRIMQMSLSGSGSSHGFHERESWRSPLSLLLIKRIRFPSRKPYPILLDIGLK